jgi:lipid A ethanolaminephosphotransferase
MASRKLNPACLTTQTTKKLSHDNYFHSVLGLMDIQTQLYKSELDIFAPCKAK